MIPNRSIPIVVVASETIPNQIRNIDDVEYELSQGGNSTNESKIKTFFQREI